MFPKSWLKRTAFLLLAFNLVLALAPAPAARAASTIRVSATGTTSWPIRVSATGTTSWPCGGTWASACALQTAFAHATNGDEVWVGKGVYKPTTSTTDRTATFQLKSYMVVYGGFALTETLRTQRDPATNIVVLSGDIDNNDGVDARGVVTTSANIHGANSYHVVTGVDGATLDGVTITGGNANAEAGLSGSGGGMVNVDYSSPTLTNVTFSGNAARYYGGGMYSESISYPMLSNVTFSGNAARYGGGMGNWNSSNPTLTNVTFSGNAATSGGGMYNYGSSPTLSNVTFSSNSATYGGGMCNVSSSPQVRNTLLWGDSGGEIYNNVSTPTISDGVVQGGCPSGSTCTRVISANPLLAPLANYGGSMQTIPLLPGSSAIAATSTNCPATDQRGVTRSPTCDIGAFESQGFTLGALTGTPQIAIVNTGFAQPLGLSVTSAFGEPVAGGLIAFTAPASGASLAEVTPFAKTISVSGAVSAAVTANGLTGSYSVTASARGATSVNFALTNLGQILYAKPGGATSGLCQSWAAGCELRYALNLALPGSNQEIWAAAGVYTSTATPTDRAATFQLKNGVAVYGGFGMTETLRTQRDPAANIVVLSGDIDNNDGVDARGVVTTAANIHGANSYHVVTGVDGATLDGVTITAGNATGDYPKDFGGGMRNDSSSPTLSNVTFSGNTATYGGGIGNVSNSPTLSNVTFSGNSATYSGGGMYNTWYSSPTLSNVTFSGNTVGINGGGMYNESSSSPTLTNVTFSGNAANYGGGMFNYTSSPTLTNVTFSGNAATSGGGGMYNHWYSSPTLTNITFSGNAAASGGGMVNWDYSNPQVRNTLLWGDSGGEFYNVGTPTISDSVVQGGCPSDSTCTHVISADPRLAPLGNFGGSMPTIALLPGSAAIHATSTNCPATDQRGVTRGSTCDIGAFESQGFTLGALTGTPQSTIINTTFTQPLGLSVTSAFSEPVAGGVISFTAHPAVNGASLAEVTPFVKTISASGAVSATVTANGLTGSYTVTASARGATSVNFALTNKLATTTTLTSTPNPSTYGQAVTFTATVTSTLGIPSGTVNFFDNGASIGSGALNASGQVTLTTASLIAGTHPITATYGGDVNYNPSTPSIYTQTVLGQILYAKPGGATSGVCESWANGCELRYALNIAIPGSNQEIWAAAGLYTPTATSTDRAASFQLKSGVVVYGGFALTETLRTQRNPAANVTVLSGDIDHNDGVDAHGVVTTSVNITGGNSCHVVMGATGATLDGVTITAGNANGSPNLFGGGMYNGGSSPTLSNVIFSGNAAAAEGGGMYNSYSNPALTNVTFSGNSVILYGGGMYNDHSSPTLTNITFSGNSAYWGGGMVNENPSSPTLTNVTFSGNSAYQGGGICGSDGLQMQNSLLWGDNGGEICDDTGTSTIRDSVVQGGCPSGSTCTNVISADPLLAPLGNYTCPDGLCQGGGSTPTFALLPGSAAINATSTNCPATDQRGVTRGSTCDIGAFESQGFTLGALTGTPQSATINTAFVTPLGLHVTSAFGEPVAGGVISFTAPVSGAGLAEVTPFAKTISASGAVSAIVTANGTSGSYTVTASASGATSVNFALTNKVDTTTTLTSAPNPSTVGQAVTFTATVTSSGGTPTGSITFTLDSTNLTVPLGANGQAVYVTQTLSLGNHPVSAAYSGDANFNASSGVLSGGQTVNDVAVTGLTSINSGPTRLTDVTYFTATINTGSSVTYQWNFGDGQTANGALSSHTYAAAGNYTALVTATNGAGSVSASTLVTIINQPPIANAGVEQGVRVNALVTLDGSGSADPDGHLPLTYGWTQSGGPSVTFTPNVSVMSFTAPSAPTVLTFTLNVTDAQGLPNLTGDSVVITVGDVAIANLTAANDSPMKVGQLTHFTATLSAGSNVIYTWDFGNGQMSSGAFSSHTYAVAGTYTATVTATNGAGSINAMTLVTIEPARLYLPLVLRR